MQAHNFILGLIFTLILNIGSNAQTDPLGNPPNYDHYSQFCAILHNGVPITSYWDTKSELELSVEKTGTLSVSTVDRTNKEYKAMKPVGFLLGIKNHRTNALWMYSNEVLYKIDVDEIGKKCEYGDQLIFITVDRKHQLPKHQLRLNIGC